MKFQQYITEENKIQTIHKGITDVYDNCMPFIKDLVQGGFDVTKKDDDLLYSARSKRDPIIKAPIRKGRKPRDMAPLRHEIFDRLLDKKFGIKGRSNALFCTGRYKTTLSYGGHGKVYMIFPVGKYKILWSDVIDDLYNSPVADMIFSEHLSAEPYSSKDEIKQAEQELNKDIISTYQTGNLMKAIRSGHEIMLNGKSYIGLDYDLFSNQIKFYITNFGTKKPTPEMLLQLTDLWPI